MKNSSLESRLIAYLCDTYGQKPAAKAQYETDHLFQSLPLENRSVLEIGAGQGFLSAFCAAKGASRVVALEPEIDGSTNGVQMQFDQMSTAIGLDKIINYRHEDLHEFVQECPKESFDYIVSFDVINHLNEDATSKLHRPEATAERGFYISAFEKMCKLLRPQGVLIVSDLGRYNFWNTVGINLPITKSIDWEKHQQPKVWKTLLAQAGFESIHIRWHTFYGLRKLSLVFSSGPGAYFLSSRFIITARKN